jgi:hypothetical protein
MLSSSPSVSVVGKPAWVVVSQTVLSSSLHCSCSDKLRSSEVRMKFSPPSADPDHLGSAETHKYPCISSSVSLSSSSSSEKLYRTRCDLGRSSRCCPTCVCILFVVGCFPFPAVLLPPVLVGSWKISVHLLHSWLRVAFVSSSRSPPLRSSLLYMSGILRFQSC